MEENMREEVNQEEYSQEQEYMEPPVSKKHKSRVIPGLAGAFIGSLLGVALWVGIYELGYIAGIAGALIVVASMKGYELLGKCLDRKGVIICAILSLVMVYFANRLSWSVEGYRAFVQEGFDVSFFDIYRGLDSLIEELEVTTEYYMDLAVGYVLFLIAGVSDVIRAFKNA